MGKNERERTGSETKKRGRKRAVGADRARNTNEREEKDTVGFSALHVVAQTNRGTRSLFLSGGCGGGGTKSLRLLSWLSCVFLSFSPFLSLPLFLFLFLQPLFPAFPSSSLVHSFAPAHRHSLFPFATAVLSSLFFSLLATPLFMPPHSSGPSLSRARFPLCPTREITPSLFLPFSHLLLLHFQTQPSPSLFRQCSLPPLSQTPLLRRANRSRTRASEREDQNRIENEEVRKKERIRVPYT